MTRATLVVILILFSVFSVSFVDSLLVHESVGKFLRTFGGTVKQVKIPDLLNQVCNQSQGSNATLRDACYGCFYRASVLPQGYPMLVSMSMCANTYLNNTSYGHCQAYLQNVTSVPNGRSPSLIYCSFLECIRQVNKNTLLGECVREAATVFPSIDNTYVNLTDAQLAQLFLNITVCVLAKTRCSYMNPVTGELQEDDIVNKLQLPSLNAILVNTDFDITILQMPFRHSSVDVCAKYRNVEQATWPGVAC